MYLFGYGLGRVWIEGLRTDQLLLPEIGLPVSQLLAGALVIGTGIALLYLGRHHKNSPMHRSVTKYEPMPEKIKGKKPPKWNERLFQRGAKEENERLSGRMEGREGMRNTSDKESRI